MEITELLSAHFTYRGDTVSRFREVTPAALRPGDAVYYKIRRPMTLLPVQGPFTLVTADEIDVKLRNQNGIEFVLSAITLILLRREEDDAVALVRAKVQRHIDTLVVTRSRLAAEMADTASDVIDSLGYVVVALREGGLRPVKALGQFQGTAPLFDAHCARLREIDKQIHELTALLALCPTSARVGNDPPEGP